MLDLYQEGDINPIKIMSVISLLLFLATLCLGYTIYILA